MLVFKAKTTAKVTPVASSKRYEFHFAGLNRIPCEMLLSRRFT